MGQGLTKIAKSIDDSNDAGKEALDALNALVALGQSRKDVVYSRAMYDRMKITIPVQKVLLQRQSIVSITKTSIHELSAGIREAVGNLMQGPMVDGVTDILQGCLNTVLGESGQISNSYANALIATDLGALLRIDIDVYSFKINSEGLRAHAANMTAITSIVSTINPTSLSANNLRDIVWTSYSNSTEARQKQILELVQAAWENDCKQSVSQNLTTQQGEVQFRF